MRQTTIRMLSLLDVVGLPAFVLSYIWKLQFSARPLWIIFPAWIVLSFLAHRDTPKTLGWRADNLWPATRLTAIALVIMAAALVVIGLILGPPLRPPPNLRSLHRLWAYFAFCLLQQVAVNSLLNNRFLSLVSKPWRAALLTAVVFAACHWPNPVLVPLTLIGGFVMAWIFARHRNILPLAVAQAILGSLAWSSFPLAWHHRLRVGPAFYAPWR